MTVVTEVTIVTEVTVVTIVTKVAEMTKKNFFHKKKMTLNTFFQTKLIILKKLTKIL